MWGVLFLGLLLVVVAAFSWLEIQRQRAEVKDAKAKAHAAKVALESSEAKDRRRDDATVATAVNMSATVEAKRGSAPRPRSKVLDELRK